MQPCAGAPRSWKGVVWGAWQSPEGEETAVALSIIQGAPGLGGPSSASEQKGWQGREARPWAGGRAQYQHLRNDSEDSMSSNSLGILGSSEFSGGEGDVADIRLELGPQVQVMI